MTESLRYVEVRPTGLLAEYVESIWCTRAPVERPAELIEPTGSSVAAIVLGDPIRHFPLDEPYQVHRAITGFLIGPHDRPFMSRPEGATFCVGVVATPVGCAAAFGLPPSQIKRTVTDLNGCSLAGPELRADLHELDEPTAMIDRIAALLTEIVVPPDQRIRRCQHAIEVLTRDPERSIDTVAYELSVSHGALDEEFKLIVGLGPRAMARILRLRALLAQVDIVGINTWERSASAAGWFDRPLLIRDFRRHTGMTPREFVKARRTPFRPESGSPV